MKLPQWMEDLWLQDQAESQQARQQGFSQDLQLSSDAKRILEEPLIQRFFAVNEERLMAIWKQTEPSQLERREAAYNALYQLLKFKEYLEQFLANEQYALQQLEDLAKE